jgi:hypothetical protein
VKRRRVGGAIAALCLCLAVDGQTAGSTQDMAMAKQRDGSLAIAGRSLRCGNARNVLDPRLPNLGVADERGLIVVNPRLLKRFPETVRLFVYHHECGHLHVGASETAADCWAVKQGLAQGWLDRGSLQQVCRSFGNAPATSTHPSGARRCASLDRCFTTAVAAAAKQKPAATAEAAQAEPSPKLLSGPTLRRSGMRPPSTAKE